MGVPHKPMPLVLSDEETYPSVRMVEIKTIPDSIGMVSFNNKKKVINVHMEDNDEDGMVSFIGRKRIMSKEHAIIFKRSLIGNKKQMWVFNFPLTWVMYGCGVCGHAHTLEIIMSTS